MEESAQVDKKVRTASAWLSTNSTLQADGWGTKRSIRKTEKTKHTIKKPTIQGHVIAMDYTRGARGCVALRKVLLIRTFVPNAPKTEDF